MRTTVGKRGNGRREKSHSTAWANYVLLPTTILLVHDTAKECCGVGGSARGGKNARSGKFAGPASDFRGSKCACSVRARYVMLRLINRFIWRWL